MPSFQAICYVTEERSKKRRKITLRPVSWVDRKEHQPLIVMSKDQLKQDKVYNGVQEIDFSENICRWY